MLRYVTYWLALNNLQSDLERLAPEELTVALLNSYKQRFTVWTQQGFDPYAASSAFQRKAMDIIELDLATARHAIPRIRKTLNKSAVADIESSMLVISVGVRLFHAGLVARQYSSFRPKISRAVHRLGNRIGGELERYLRAAGIEEEGLDDVAGGLSQHGLEIAVEA